MISTPFSSKPKILVVLHQEASTPGRVGMLLEEMGYRMIACRPPLGEELPETLEEYAGVVVFGGPMSANDPDEFVKREIDWMEVPLRENKPFFGICLGAQMLTKHLGGVVEGHNAEFAEIGYYPVEPTTEGAALLDWPEQVYQWHREGFSLPKDATLLATGSHYPNQAFRYRENAFGIQFHSEVTTMMMHRWTIKAAHRFSLPGAQNRTQQFAARPKYDPAIKQWLIDFLDLWVGPAEKQS